MVDPWVLANDILANIGGTSLTPLLWLGLFLWAWSRPSLAQASGFGRLTFWLLLPGAFLSSLADVPFLPWAGNVLAINVGGALIPIVLTVILLRRELGVPGWTLAGTVLGVLTAETAAQFAVVLLAPSSTAGLWVLAAAGGTVAVAAVLFPWGAPRPAAARAVTFIALVSMAISLTFYTSQAEPGVGIVSAFPSYLIGPVLVGAVSAWTAYGVWGVPAYRGLGIAFGAATLGTLIGADVLREPPLYGGAGGALLAIGGAGIQDLVYFSGLLAVGAGLLVVLALSRPAPLVPPAPSPIGVVPGVALRSAAERLEKGDPVGAVQASVAASRAAAEKVRTIYRIPESGPPETAWDPLPVAPYVRNDYRNLIASTTDSAPSPRAAARSVVMATQLVRLGRDLSRLRFAPPGPRGWAAVVDLLVVTAPAVVLWAFLARTEPGSIAALLVGLPFNVAVFGFIGYAVLYYVVGDALFGVTVGKALFHLSVTDRAWARPTVLQSFLREAPKAVPIYVIGEFGAPAVLLLLRSNTSSVSPFGIDLLLTGTILLVITVLVVFAALAVGGVQVARDSERQRLGDRWAATWVVDRKAFTPAWGATRETPVEPPVPARAG